MRTKKRKQQQQEAINLLFEQQSSRRNTIKMTNRQERSKNWLSTVVVVIMTSVAISSISSNKQIFLVSSAQTTSSHTANTNNHLAGPSSGIRFSPETNAYSGLTFTFDPRLDKRVEWLHFEHWLSIMHQSSELLHEALNGRAHLGEVRVLIPYKWRHIQWPVLNKPGAPIIMNRRLRYTDSDVIVGFDDPIYKETPFAVQHDECARQGLHISMPISFLEQDNNNNNNNDSNEKQSNDPRLKARLLVREFASHRYGLFKESGLRNDFMYPPFSSLAGLSLSPSPSSGSNNKRTSLLANHRSMPSASGDNQTSSQQQRPQDATNWPADYSLRGFDPDWQECSFDTRPQNGLPSPQSANCFPYLTRASSQPSDKSSSPSSGQSFNLMSADPFSHADLSARFAGQQQQHRPVEWRDLADSVKWHFCGDNFASSAAPLQSHQSHQQRSAALTNDLQQDRQESYAHNQLANNKQNVLCQERSAMEIIKASEDFKRPTFSPSTFNRLPAPNFSFLQEMPPRVILCVEYVAHLFQSRRLDHGILEAAIGKFLAYDLIADSEIALVLFGQRNSSRQSFERLDSSIKSRLTLYNPAIDPFDEPVRYYTEQELSQLFNSASSASSLPSLAATSAAAAAADQSNNQQQQQQQQPKIVKGTCSFAKLLQEVSALQQQRSHQYDDVGADIVIISSGLFIEDEPKIEEIVRAQFRPDSHKINLIIYPSTMIFDTKSHVHQYPVLDAAESEAVVKNRLGKLLLIQRLTNANIHLVKEHLDYNGDVKMSTLLQFYQIFDHISKGHSWDQQQSMMLLAHESVPQPPQVSSNRLTFQFHVDASIQNELIVAFIDPKQHLLVLKPGNRFILRNLELRSPGGQLVLTDSHPWPSVSTNSHHYHHQPVHRQSMAAADAASSASELVMPPVAATASEHQQPLDELNEHHSHQNGAGSTNIESALFPFRTQLGLAGFHLKPAHLALLLNQTSGSGGISNSNKISGLWTLSATSDEILQTSAIAMARVNPAGDTITSNCWIQTYYDDPAAAAASGSSRDTASDSSEDQQPALKSVKVFVQSRGPAGMGPIQEVQARLEVQDELGNIVQNVDMLDDGLGAPDITRADGIQSQYVQRTHGPGFYKVHVEMTGKPSPKHQPVPSTGQSQSQSSSKSSGFGQDNTCCGSFVPSSPADPSSISTRHLSRQLYCGTFYVESNNKLSQQRPPRVNNLTIVSVDQELRQVTLRWFEPSTGTHTSSTKIRFARSTGGLKRSGRSQADDDLDDLAESSSQQVRNHQVAPAKTSQQQQQQLEPGNRYEIKLFSDRDILKRSFDVSHMMKGLEVGYKFSELNVVDGSFPNASSYGGTKEVTLRLPNGREGIYYLAMRVYSNLGIGSQVSNIVQLWARTNMTEQEELESIYGQPVTVDANGNVYDKNGELIGQRNFAASSSSSSSSNINGLLRVPNSHLDGIGVLLFISACALLFLILSIWLFACIVSSARRSLKVKRNLDDDHDNIASSAGKQIKKMNRNKKGASGSTAILANGGNGSSSSMVSSTSQCEASSSRSSGTGSVGGGSQQDINKLTLAANEVAEHLSYSQLRHQHQVQQQQADHIKQAYLQRQYTANLTEQTNNWHTMVNGYAYATVASQQQFHHDDLTSGDLNQNGLGTIPNQSDQFQREALLTTGHYDKLRGASSPAHHHHHHLNNTNHTNKRVELLPGTNNQFQSLMNGLPQVPDEFGQQSSYLIRNPNQHQEQQQHQMPSYFNNQQLQQQLSSVLKSKQQQTNNSNQDDTCDSSPALEGVAQEGHEASFIDHQGLVNYLGSAAAPPPPAQYIYQCAEANIRHQSADPSIYSQATGLQQVNIGASSPNDTGYYANSGHHYDPAGAAVVSTGIYGHSADPYNQQQQQQQQLGLPESDCLEESYDNPNSAISEV